MVHELYDLVKNFLTAYPDGMVHLIYPDEVGHTGGMELTLENIDGPRIKWLDNGLFIRQTLGYSLVTDKHLYLSYGNLVVVFHEHR